MHYINAQLGFLSEKTDCVSEKTDCAFGKTDLCIYFYCLFVFFLLFNSDYSTNEHSVSGNNQRKTGQISCFPLPDLSVIESPAQQTCGGELLLANGI